MLTIIYFGVINIFYIFDIEIINKEHNMNDKNFSVWVNDIRIDELGLMTQDVAEEEAMKFVNAGFSYKNVCIVDETTMEEIHV